MSENKVPHVYSAIREVMRELASHGIGKEKRNKDQGFSYRGVDQVLNFLSVALVKHNLVMLPRFDTHQSIARTSAKGGYLNDVIMSVDFDLVSTLDGSRHTIRTYGQGMDSADKATNKAMSGAFKYAAFLGFVIPLEGVLDDGDSETPDVAAVGSETKQHAAPKRPAAKPLTPVVDSSEMDLNTRVENVWPVMLADVVGADSEDYLRRAFTRAYTWAKELDDERISKNLLAALTEAKDQKKKELGNV